MSKIEVNAIEPQCGTNLTVGASGDTITFPSGTTVVNNGSQTGFGRTGTVDWQTGSIKTGTFTAVNGEGYFVNTSGGVSTANLPAGSAGAIVSFSDYTRTFGTNTLTITPNGSEKIGGVAASIYLSVNGQALTLVYVDATEGWINIQNAEDTEEGIVPAFITATGGTITTVDTDYKVHTFTGPGTFTVCSAGNPLGSSTVEYLVVSGGGGGGANGGGGGAGGFRFTAPSLAPLCYPAKPLAAPTGLTATVTSYPITVGGGGGGTPYGTGTATSGSNSIFSTITSAGGGYGGSIPSPFPGAGASGGSGGGGGGDGISGGAGNTPSVSPSQGSAGGNAASPNANYGGAGGALAVGAAGGPGGGGAGGVGGGLPSGFGTSGESSGGYYYFSGGGGGGTNQSPTGPPGGAGGLGGGAAGSLQEGTGGTGTTNTGGGGGGSGGGSGVSGAGGSGIVVIRYKFQ